VTGVPAPAAHGGDGPAVAAALGVPFSAVLDLSLSLNPLAPDPAPQVARHLDALSHYPDPRPAAAALADAMGVDPARLLLTNGGAEAIALVAAEIGGSVTEPEFSLHPRGHGPRWRSNPHSPTGLLAGPGDRAAVWDEAFYPLATGRWTRGDDGSVVVGSLTKLFACPGLRVGYVLGPSELLARLAHRQPAWALNGVAASVLPDLVAGADLPRWAQGVAQLRRALLSMLARHGLAARPSDANWVLVGAPGLREALAPHGVLVRDCASFGLPGVVRVAVPDSAGIERLDDALARVAPLPTPVPAGPDQGSHPIEHTSTEGVR